MPSCCIPKCKNQFRRKKKEENEKNEHNSEGKLIYKNLNNCGHAENLGALFLTKVVTKFHNNTESILLRYL
jgi:hypothetical protein